MKSSVEGSASAATSAQPWFGRRKQGMLPLLLLLAGNWAAAKNPRDNFCRRFSHQSTVIDDKLYIDGGWVNYDDFQESHLNYSNTWLGYHDLNHVVPRAGELWPDLNISLSKNNSIPMVSGGVLWPDAVNKRFYLYGGDWNSGFATESYHLWSYDIIYDKWDDFGQPDLSPSPDVASFGAGVGVSETGMGYYYGGWVSNASSSGWSKDRAMTSDFYSYNYDSGEFSQAGTPDDLPRAEGGMVWIPAGDTQGMLVYLGGLVSPYKNETTAPQPFDEIFVFDASGNSWATQKATGEVPQNRRQFCVDVAWAPDKSSFNIYLWGGHSVYPPETNATSYNDIYILTLPSFIWVKAYPDHHGNATLPPEYGHYSATCNMVKHMSQLFVIGGTYTDTDKCDGFYQGWGMHNFWTGTAQNAGDNETYWALYDPNVKTNVVPIDVYNVTGGDKEGGAKSVAPKSGFSDKPLSDLFKRRPSLPDRSPTRKIPSATGSPTSTPTPDSNSGSKKLSTGAIVGIAIGGAVVLGLITFAWYRFGAAVVKRREQKRQAEVVQQAQQMNQHQNQNQQQHQSYYGGSTVGTSSVVSPQSPVAQWNVGVSPGSPDLPPPVQPSELSAHHDSGVVDYKPSVSIGNHYQN